jgi:hypothetical protein
MPVRAAEACGDVATGDREWAEGGTAFVGVRGGIGVRGSGTMKEKVLEEGKMRGSYCQGCLENQVEMDRLKEENRRLKARLGIGSGSLIAPLHRIAHLLQPVVDKLIEEFRQAPVKHADETSWRTNGHSGYAWLFCTPVTTLFRFRRTPAPGGVAQEVFGEDPLPGDIVVDRYHAHNKAPCKL